MNEVSKDMQVLINAARAGGCTPDGSVVVPPDLVTWAQETLRRADPRERRLLDDAVRTIFPR